MKKAVLLALLFVGALSMSAQNFSGKGDSKLSVGFNGWGYGTGVKAMYDYGVSDKFSIGIGGVFFNTGDYKSKVFEDISVSAIAFPMRFHYS